MGATGGPLITRMLTRGETVVQELVVSLYLLALTGQARGDLVFLGLNREPQGKPQASAH